MELVFGHGGCNVYVSRFCRVGKVCIEVAQDYRWEVRIFVADVSDIPKIVSFIVSRRDVRANNQPLLVARHEDGIDGVGGGGCGVFKLPVGCVAPPENGYPTFVGARSTCDENVVSKLEGGVGLGGDLYFGEDTQVEVQLINCPKGTFQVSFMATIDVECSDFDFWVLMFAFGGQVGSGWFGAVSAFGAWAWVGEF